MSTPITLHERLKPEFHEKLEKAKNDFPITWECTLKPLLQKNFIATLDYLEVDALFTFLGDSGTPKILPDIHNFFLPIDHLGNLKQ